MQNKLQKYTPCIHPYVPVGKVCIASKQPRHPTNPGQQFYPVSYKAFSNSTNSRNCSTYSAFFLVSVGRGSGRLANPPYPK